MARTDHVEGTPERVLPVLTTALRHRWTSSVFGIVTEGSVRRRPSDVARLVTSVVVVGLTAAAAREGTVIEAGVLSFLASLPGSLGRLFSFVYGLGVGVAAALVVTALAARRPRLLLTMLVGSATTITSESDPGPPEGSTRSVCPKAHAPVTPHTHMTSLGLPRGAGSVSGI